MDAVVVRGLSKKFKKHVVIPELNFTLPEASSLAIVGPDGAGKTTTMRMLAGLLQADTGRISICGYAPGSAEAKNILGYVSQRYSLYSDLSVEENIDFFARIHSLRDYQAIKKQLLTLTDLWRFLDRPSGKLSGGMKQKLALSCALIHRPRLLLLDEPTTGVDPIARREFWAILSELLKEGMTIIVTTPYMDEAERCTYVAMMDKGRFSTWGTPSALKEQLKYEILELIIEDTRHIAKIIEKSLTGVESVQSFGDRLAILVPSFTEGEAELHKILQAQGLTQYEIRKAPPQLENVFMEQYLGLGNK